jgi:hypothetical protein
MTYHGERVIIVPSMCCPYHSVSYALSLLTSHLSHPRFRVSHLSPISRLRALSSASSVDLLLSLISHLLSPNSHLVSPTSRLQRRVSNVASPTSRLASHISCLASLVSRLSSSISAVACPYNHVYSPEAERIG